VTGGVGATINVPVTVWNVGTMTWTPGQVNLSYHITSPSGAVVVWDGARTVLTATVGPNQTQTLQALVGVPQTAGSYTVSFDLVQEGVSWFSDQDVSTQGVTLSAQ